MKEFLIVHLKVVHANAKLYFHPNLELLNNVSLVVGILYSSIKKYFMPRSGHEGQNCFPSHKTLSSKSVLQKQTLENCKNVNLYNKMTLAEPAQKLNLIPGPPEDVS